MNLGLDLSQMENDKASANPKSSSQSGTVSEEHAKEILNNVLKKVELSTLTDAMVMVAGLCQTGATNARAGNNAISFSWKNKTMTNTQLAECCYSTENGKSVKYTIRQLARTFADQIKELGTV